DTPGAMSNVETDGSVQHATVTTTYQGCIVRRTLALVRGRYVLIADRIVADKPHEYAWQVRSICPPESPGTRLGKRDVTWPGLDAKAWRALRPGKAQLTTVAPPFAELTLEKGRFRPQSSKEFLNQVAIAKWRAKNTTALFALIPNLRETPDLGWTPLAGQNLEIKGPEWTDRVIITAEELSITGSDGQLNCQLHL
ncbi:MAG: heparinase II/III family protein, partial [Lentisphaeria bacterium]|nr:heparinase II/III family protein [Lentisphaeria bacterium]